MKEINICAGEEISLNLIPKSCKGMLEINTHKNAIIQINDNRFTGPLCKRKTRPRYL